MIQSWGDIAGIILILAFIFYNLFTIIIPSLRKKDKKIIEKKFWRFLVSFYIFCVLVETLAFWEFGIFTIRLLEPILPTFILAIVCLVIWGIVKGLIWIINKIKSRQNKESEK